MASKDPFSSPLLSRRGLVKNTALMTLLAPVLRRRDAYGQAAASPRRAVFIFCPNGPMRASGTASGTEKDFKIHDWWKAFEPHKAEGIFMSHLAASGCFGGASGGAHEVGAQTFRGNGSSADMDSVGQIIGKRLEAEKKAGIKRAVTWGTSGQARSGGVGDPFASGGRKISPELSPQKAWAELFSQFVSPSTGGTTSAEEIKRAERLIAREKSVLDFVSTNCQALRDALGREGMILLDEHCTTVRSMEDALKTSLTMPSAASNKCQKPASPGEKDWANPENIDGQAAAFVDLIATAFACELTRVVEFQFGAGAARNRLASKYGVPSSPRVDSGDSGPAHHPWTHAGGTGWTVACRIFSEFYANKTALLLNKLKTTMDAQGKPLMDSTVVVFTNELGGSSVNGDSHQMGSVPAAFFGHGQGTFKTGRYLRGASADTRGRAESSGSKREAGRQHAQMLISVMHYMGLTDVNRIGRSDASGPLMPLYG
jgi:hypothetical protein